MFSICCDTNGLIMFTSSCFVRDYFFLLQSHAHRWQIFHSHQWVFNQTLHSICIYVKNVWLNFFFIVCSFFLFWCSIRSSLLRQRISLSLQMSHTKCSEKEREEKKTAVRAGSLFLFLLFDCLPLSVSFFISAFVIFPPSLYDTRCSLRTSWNLTRTNTRFDCTMFIHIRGCNRCRWWRSEYEPVGVTIVNT